MTHFSLPFLRILSFFDLLAFSGRNLMLFCLVSQCFRIRSQMFICKRETELLKLFSLPFFHKCYHTLILTCEISLLLAFPGRNLLSDAFLPHKSMFPNPLFSSRGFFFVLFSRVFFSYSVVNLELVSKELNHFGVIAGLFRK